MKAFSRVRSSSGGTLIEFAGMFPLFLVLIFSCFEITYLLRTREQIASSAIQSAREAIMDAKRERTVPACNDYVVNFSRRFSKRQSQQVESTFSITEFQRSNLGSVSEFIRVQVLSRPKCQLCFLSKFGTSLNQVFILPTGVREGCSHE